MSALDILNVYIQFFEKRDHKRIENSSLVPQNDPTTLFTSSGMQPIIKYLLGQPHPEGKRLVNVQNCFRAQDIDEIGDNRHTTFFRMLGNWSLGDYFKNEEIPWFWEFLVDELKLDPKRLYVSVFEGYKNIPRDEESALIWKSLFEKAGIDSSNRIFYCGVEDNWWSRSGTPDHMPAGEPGGPDTEVYFDFRPEEGEIAGDLDKHSKSGRLLEIGNSVFMTYQSSFAKASEGQEKPEKIFIELPQKNVDFGGGLERLLAAVEEKEDIFQTSLLLPIVESIEKVSGKSYKENSRAIRIIVDHLVASVFITANGISPSNKEQGYVLRRLLRRAIRYAKQLGSTETFTAKVASAVIDNYSDTDPKLTDNKKVIEELFLEEEKKFNQVIQEGLKLSEKIFSALTPIESIQYSKIMQIKDKKEIFREIFRRKETSDNSNPFGLIKKNDLEKATLTGTQAFDLFQSFGFPVEMIIELAQEKRLFVDLEAFGHELEKHQEMSRKGAKKKFKS